MHEVVRRHRVGLLIVAAALTTALWASGCGSGGDGDGGTAQANQYSVAQLILLRGGANAERDLQVLLARNGPKAIFSPNAWVLPSGAARPDGGGQGVARAAAVSALAQQTRIKVDADSLTPYANWIVPGFDTVYYLVLTPRDVVPHPDGTQFVDAVWIEPQRALAMHRAGKLQMDYLTVKQLESLVGFANATDALQTARSHEVTPVQLQIVGQGDKARAVLPEDAPQG